MSEGKRPGGLTALAVLNFVFSGLSILSLLGMIAFFALIGKIPTEDMNEQNRVQIEALQELGTPVLVLSFALSALGCLFLFLSGIGYLKQKKFLGRGMGNAYGIFALISSVITGLLFSPDLGGGFSIGTIIGLIYPLLTLILINTTFKDDLVN